jgi:hypothetical protein
LGKTAVTTRVTNDDAVNGVADSFPSVWMTRSLEPQRPWAPRLWNLGRRGDDAAHDERRRHIRRIGKTKSPIA